MEDFKPRFSPDQLEAYIDKLTVEERLQLIVEIRKTMVPSDSTQDWRLILLDERIADAMAERDEANQQQKAIDDVLKKS